MIDNLSALFDTDVELISKKKAKYYKLKNDIGLYCDVTSRFADERLSHIIKEVLRLRDWLETNDPSFPK